jgi:hypothetical protein
MFVMTAEDSTQRWVQVDQAAMLFLVQHGYRVICIDRRGHDFEIESSGAGLT